MSDQPLDGRSRDPLLGHTAAVTLPPLWHQMHPELLTISIQHAMEEATLRLYMLMAEQSRKPIGSLTFRLIAEQRSEPQ